MAKNSATEEQEVIETTEQKAAYNEYTRFRCEGKILPEVAGQPRQYELLFIEVLRDNIKIAPNTAELLNSQAHNTNEYLAEKGKYQLASKVTVSAN